MFRLEEELAEILLVLLALETGSIESEEEKIDARQEIGERMERMGAALKSHATTPKLSRLRETLAYIAKQLRRRAKE